MAFPRPSRRKGNYTLTNMLLTFHKKQCNLALGTGCNKFISTKQLCHGLYFNIDVHVQHIVLQSPVQFNVLVQEQHRLFTVFSSNLCIVLRRVNPNEFGMLIIDGELLNSRDVFEQNEPASLFHFYPPLQRIHGRLESPQDAKIWLCINQAAKTTNNVKNEGSFYLHVKTQQQFPLFWVGG